MIRSYFKRITNLPYGTQVFTNIQTFYKNTQYTTFINLNIETDMREWRLLS